VALRDDLDMGTQAQATGVRSLDRANESARQYKQAYEWGDLAALEASLKIVTVYSASMAALARAFNSIGVWKSFGRYSVLKTLFLSNQTNMGQGELSKILGVTGPNVSYLLDSLEEEGLVRRIPAKNDRRFTEVTLTESGRELCEKLVPAAVQFSSDLLAGFSDDEKQTVNRLLEKIQANAEKLHVAEAIVVDE
jgi:DNA-binding MarR family transcriptional regulator